MSKLGMQGAICVPNTISATKEAALTSRGARIIKHGADCVEAENFARKMAQVRQFTGKCHVIKTVPNLS